MILTIKQRLQTPVPFRSGLLLLIVAAVFMTGCGRGDAIQEVGAEQMYQDGREAILNNNFAGAVANFQDLIVRYPLSPQSRQARLDLVYAYYQSGQPEAALDFAETFIRENPRLPEVAYCLYMIGMIHFDSEPNFIERLFRVDITQRPPAGAMESFDAFQQLILNYPESRWVEDARQRMVYLRNRLATYENHVARYYINRGAYVAAINRGKYALENYAGAPELADTLALMVESYEAIGMLDLAADTRRVLELNFGTDADASGA